MPIGYTEIILEATGCSTNEAVSIEEIMRDDIFHSTLDWQTREQLQSAARLAYLVFREINSNGTPSTDS